MTQLLISFHSFLCLCLCLSLPPSLPPSPALSPSLPLSLRLQACVPVTVAPGKKYVLVPAAWGPGVQGVCTFPRTHVLALVVDVSKYFIQQPCVNLKALSPFGGPSPFASYYRHTQVGELTC